MGSARNFHRQRLRAPKGVFRVMSGRGAQSWGDENQGGPK